MWGLTVLITWANVWLQDTGPPSRVSTFVPSMQLVELSEVVLCRFGAGSSEQLLALTIGLTTLHLINKKIKLNVYAKTCTTYAWYSTNYYFWRTSYENQKNSDPIYGWNKKLVGGYSYI